MWGGSFRESWKRREEGPAGVVGESGFPVGVREGTAMPEGCLAGVGQGRFRPNDC